MGEITYRCNLCKTEIVKIVLRKEDYRGFMWCGGCGGVFERVLKAPTSKVVERKDDGFSPRAVEQLKDIGEILKERSDKHDKSTKN